MADKTITYEFVGDTSKLRKDVRKLGRSMKNMGKRAQRVGKTLSTYVTAPIAAAGAAAIKFAADAEKTGNKLNSVFGESSGVVEGWASTVGSETGVARQELESFAATMGDTLKPMGASEDQALSMSQQLGEIGSDLAAFNNEAPAESFANLRRAITGSAESVKQYGIDVQQSAVNQELMNQGVAGGVEAATRAQKAQARLAIITRETADAQGAAARDADTFSGQVRRLRSNLSNMAVTVGNILLPIARQLANWANDAATLFGRLSGGMQKVVVAISAIAAIIPVLLTAFGTLVGTLLPGLITGASTAASVFATMWAAITGPVGLAIAGIAALGTAAYFVVNNWQEVKSFFGQLFDAVISAASIFTRGLIGLFEVALSKIELAMLDALDTIIGSVQDFLSSIGASGLAEALDPVSEGAQRLADHSRESLGSAREDVDRLEEGFESLGNTITTSVSGAYDAAAQSASDFFAGSEPGEASGGRTSGGGATTGQGGGGSSSSGGSRGGRVERVDDTAGLQGGNANMEPSNIRELTEAQRERHRVTAQAMEKQRQLNLLGIEIQNRVRQGAVKMSKALGDNLTTAIFEGKSAFEAFGNAALGMLKSIVSQLISAVAQATLLKTLTGGLGGVGGLVGAVGGVLGFASGGIVTKPTLGVIGEGTESEAVMPLSKLNSFVDQGGGGRVTINPQVLPSGDLTFAQREGDRRRRRLGRAS